MAALGTDIAGVFDIDATLSVVSGQRALAQQILRRLTTPRGGLLIVKPNGAAAASQKYGYDLRHVIGSLLPEINIERGVLEQVLDEEEVEDARVSAVRDGATMTITVTVVAAEGPFELTILSAADLTLTTFIGGEQVA